jgi:radical SAM protein with 4Fe4S-binding SPASM domain
MKARNLSGQAPGGQRRRLADLLPLDTPMVVQIFPVYACNFKCEYCIFCLDRSHHGFISDTVTMDFDLFQKVVDDLAQFPEKIKVLRFVGIGEPLLHPKIVDMIRLASETGVADVIELITNASLLKPDASAALVSAGLNRLVVSLQGTSGAKYSEVCGKTLDFDAFVKNLRHFYDHRSDCHVYLKIVDAALDGPEDEQRFFDLFGNICDTIAVEQAVPIHSGIPFNKTLQHKDRTQFGLPLSEVAICPQPFFTLQVNPDGKVVPCYSFEYPGIMGDCNQETLQEIWSGEIFRQFRLRWLDGLMAEPCQQCSIIKYRMFPEDDLSGDASRLRDCYER